MGTRGLNRAQAFRTTRGADIAPDGSSVAYLVDDGDGPFAVQRFLDGWRTGTVRRVRLPVEGPVHKVRYSEHGSVLALEVAPGAGERHEVWLVTSDPADASARRMCLPGDLNATLIGFREGRLMLTARVAGGIDESRIIDPRTGRHVVVDGDPEHELLDHRGNDVLIRAGRRGRRGMLLRRGTAERGRVAHCLREIAVEPLAPEADSYPGFLVRDAWTRRTGGARVLLRSEAGADAARLVETDVLPDGGGTAVREVAALPGAELDDFRLSEDGTTALLLFNREGYTSVRRYRVAEGRMGPDVGLPGAVASEPRIDREGCRATLTVAGPGLPETVVMFDCGTRRMTFLDDHRVASEVDADLAPARRWTVTRDGTRVESLVYEPVPAVPSVAPADSPPPLADGPLADDPLADGPVPTILWFHGGPEFQSRPVHDPMVEGLRRAGFRVVLPNVRGSTGYGRAFARADDRHRRNGSITDALDVAADLVDAGLASRDRLFCSGRSYGGYLTNCLMSMHPGAFAAGVAVCGMSDLQNFYEETEPWIASAAYPKYGHPLDDAELLAAYSPLRNAGSVAAPLLTIHGALDTNVVPAESRRMVAAVRAYGGVADMMEFPDEGHAILRTHNLDRMVMGMSRWFGDVLRGRRPNLAAYGLGCAVDFPDVVPDPLPAGPAPAGIASAGPA